MCEDKSTRTSPRAFLSNLAGPEPWTQKLPLLLRNNWLKLKNLQNCCGHPGEPGQSGVFGVSVLDESVPMTFLGPFGFRSGRDIDKLIQVQYKIGVTGCPLVLEHALSVLEAKVIDQIDLGTHTIFIGDTVNAEVLKEGRPLTYRYYQEFLKGKAPATAPTFNPVK